MDRRMLKESAKQSVLEARGPVKRVTLGESGGKVDGVDERRVAKSRSISERLFESKESFGARQVVPNVVGGLHRVR